MSDKENKAVVTDIHEMIEREVEHSVDQKHKAYFESVRNLHDKFDSVEQLIIDTSPRRVTVVVDNIVTKAAIIVLYIIMLIGCTS